jgi:hypothetical protein
MIKGYQSRSEVDIFIYFFELKAGMIYFLTEQPKLKDGFEWLHRS